MHDLTLAKQAFLYAETHGNAKELEPLLNTHFRGVGPKGFVLNKQQWIDRHQHYSYISLTTEDEVTEPYEQTAIVWSAQYEVAKYKGSEVKSRSRVTQVWIQDQDTWKLAAMQFSFIGNV